MGFNEDDIVRRKVGGTQKYKVVEVLPIVTTDKYACVFEPEMGAVMKMTFKGSDIELVP